MKKRLLLSALLMIVVLPLHAGGRDSKYVETYLQYVPALMHMGLGAVGVDSYYGASGRGVEMAYAYGAEVLMVNALLKSVVKEERPDGSSFNSFPSGHTATAFAGAELVRLEYGWGWGAGAYALATGVGALRVHHQRHWWWDAIAGAGAGILSANIGRWLTNSTFSVLPIADPSRNVYGASFALTF